MIMKQEKIYTKIFNFICACFQSNNQKTDQSARIYQEWKTRKKREKSVYKKYKVICQREEINNIVY